MDKSIVEKYFNNECTEPEARKVLQWFDTPEGEKYLRENMDDNIRLLKDDKIKPMIAYEEKNEMWDNIRSRIWYPKKNRMLVWDSSYLSKIAVILFIFGISSVLYVWRYHFYSKSKENYSHSQPIHYHTTTDEIKSLILKDSSQIVLNSGSDLWISRNYSTGDREVKLQGEALFKVIHNTEHPFLIHVHGILIKDLGTTFNVKAKPQQENVQIAVTEGKVAFESQKNDKKQAILLSKGQFGYLDLENRTSRVDNFEVNNYLSWHNGNLTYTNTSLKKVCTQLGRLYDVSFEFSSHQMYNKKLTMDIKRGSLKNVLNVISLTLNISYQKKENIVTWMNQ